MNERPPYGTFAADKDYQPSIRPYVPGAAGDVIADILGQKFDKPTEFDTVSVHLYEPWLLGFCRWEVTLGERLTGLTAVMTTTVAKGSWKWRGRHAKYAAFTGTMTA